MAMLEIKDLHVHYGVIEALKGISLEVNEGEIVALIGANGAGKTTTLNILGGIFDDGNCCTRTGVDFDHCTCSFWPGEIAGNWVGSWPQHW